MKANYGAGSKGQGHVLVGSEAKPRKFVGFGAGLIPTAAGMSSGMCATFVPDADGESVAS